MGTAVHYYLRTAGGTRLVAYRQNNSPPPAGLVPGASVLVAWEPDSARWLRE